MLLGTALIHRGALSTGFALDDLAHLERVLTRTPPPDLFRLFGAEGFFLVLHPLFGLEPLGYHVVALLLHLVNTAGLYVLCRALPLPRLGPAAIALVFGCSAIAFTPLHWTSAVSDILAGTFLLITVAIVFAPGEQVPMRFVLGIAAFGAAVLAKEVTLVWPAVALCFAWLLPARSVHASRHMRVTAVMALVALIRLIVTQRFDTLPVGAYALAFDLRSLLHALFTYVLWTLEFWQAFPDLPSSVVDVSIPSMIIILAALAISVALAPAALRRVAGLGLAWWLLFASPTLPLLGHLLRYYLYVPWLGGSVAVVALACGALERQPRRVAQVAWGALIVAYLVGSVIAIESRRATRRHALPRDSTLRSAELLRNAVTSLERTMLVPGSSIGFVNPVPAEPMPAVTSTGGVAPTASRTTYRPLEAALLDGAAIAVFSPQLRYQGFSDTIPDTWARVECFYYEQRGWLQHWGSGAAALEQQLHVQLAAGRHPEAERTRARLRQLRSGEPVRTAP